ncbi:MAG: hypothetical protein RBU21_18850, partial [FCB group bacterium]|nr:hypothetical protein [FCB group bacterium]
MQVNRVELRFAGAKLAAGLCLAIIALATAGCPRPATHALAPVVRALAIYEGQEATTSRTVTLNNCTVHRPVVYMASESPDFSTASWQDYSKAPTFLLSPGDAMKKVYFKTMNAWGESATVYDTITLNEPSIRYVSEQFWPELPQPWYFNAAEDVAVNSKGEIAIADTGNNSIVLLAADGTYGGRAGGRPGNGLAQFSNPRSVAFDASDNLYIADTDNNRIQKFSPGNKTPWESWGGYGTGNREFAKPWGIAAGVYGEIYIADRDNNRIQKLSSNGNFLAKWGEFGSGDNCFKSPRDVAVDASGLVYVADTFNSRIKKFTPDGVFLESWRYNEGDWFSDFAPVHLKVDPSGNVYATDFGSYGLVKFSPDGASVTKLVTEVEGNPLYFPTGMDFDSLGNIYVPERHNYRILIIGPG